MQIMEYFNDLENIELYIIVALFVFTLWFIFNTIKYYKGEKRKVKHLHRFAKEVCMPSVSSQLKKETPRSF